MSTEGAESKAEMPELDLWGSGRNPQRHQIESAPRVTVGTEPRNAAGTATMEAVVSRENMLLALHAVERNRGAAGVDGMTTGQLRGHLRQQWEWIKAHLLEGIYQPQPVRRVDIPKPGGGTRMLGIPTVVDRLIQQAMHSGLYLKGSGIVNPSGSDLFAFSASFLHLSKNPFLLFLHSTEASTFAGDEKLGSDNMEITERRIVSGV